MHWGHKIALGYLGFVAFIVMLAVLCVRQEMPLVAADYYRQEIAYQERIDQMENTRIRPLRFEFDREARRAVVTFPNGSEGEIHFFRPDDARQDFRVVVAPDADGRQRIDLQKRTPGLWRVKVQWQIGEETYYDERQMVL